MALNFDDIKQTDAGDPDESKLALVALRDHWIEKHGWNGEVVDGRIVTQFYTSDIEDLKKAQAALRSRELDIYAIQADAQAHIEEAKLRVLEAEKALKDERDAHAQKLAELKTAAKSMSDSHDAAMRAHGNALAELLGVLRTTLFPLVNRPHAFCSAFGEEAYQYARDVFLCADDGSMVLKTLAQDRAENANPAEK